MSKEVFGKKKCKCLKILKNDKIAHGVTGEILKCESNSLLEWLYDFFNVCIKTTFVPDFKEECQYCFPIQGEW